MVCTDAAGRGIDIPDITHVVQADFAASAVDFLHRVSLPHRDEVMWLAGFMYSWLAHASPSWSPLSLSSPITTHACAHSQGPTYSFFLSQSSVFKRTCAEVRARVSACMLGCDHASASVTGHAAPPPPHHFRFH
jgi:superfamily II DNA/RNA helicase